MADRLTIEHYIGEAFVKCGQVILGSRILPNGPVQQQGRSARDKRAGRWFLLELDEVDGVGKEVEVWRKDISSPLVIEIHMAPGGVAAALAAAAAASAAGPSGGGGSCLPAGGGGGGAAAVAAAAGGLLSTPLERWTLQYDRSCPLPGSSNSMADSSSGAVSSSSSTSGAGSSGTRTYLDDVSVYKRLTILVRSLYSFARVLPAYRLFRTAKRSAGEQFQFQLQYRIYRTLQQAVGSDGGGALCGDGDTLPRPPPPRLQDFAFAPVDTPGGRFRVAVQYNPAATALVLEHSTAPMAMPYTLNENYLGPFGAAAAAAGGSLGPPAGSRGPYGTQPFPGTSAPSSAGMAAARHMRPAMSTSLSGPTTAVLMGRSPPAVRPADGGILRHAPSAGSFGVGGIVPGSGAAAASAAGGGGGGGGVPAAGGPAAPPRVIVRQSWSSKEMKVSFSLPPPLGSPGGLGGGGGGGVAGGFRRSSSGYGSTPSTPPLPSPVSFVRQAQPGSSGGGGGGAVAVVGSYNHHHRPPPCHPPYHRYGSSGGAGGSSVLGTTPPRPTAGHAGGAGRAGGGVSSGAVPAVSSPAASSPGLLRAVPVESSSVPTSAFAVPAWQHKMMAAVQGREEGGGGATAATAAMEVSGTATTGRSMAAAAPAGAEDSATAAAAAAGSSSSSAGGGSGVTSRVVDATAAATATGAVGDAAGVSPAVAGVSLYDEYDGSRGGEGDDAAAAGDRSSGGGSSGGGGTRQSTAAVLGVGGTGSGTASRTTSAPLAIPSRSSSRTRSVVDLRAPAVYGGFEVHPAVAAAAASSRTAASVAAAAAASGLLDSQDGAAAAVAAQHRMAPGSAPAAPRGMLGLALGAMKPGGARGSGIGGGGAAAAASPSISSDAAAEAAVTSGAADGGKADRAADASAVRDSSGGSSSPGGGDGASAGGGCTADVRASSAAPRRVGDVTAPPPRPGTSSSAAASAPSPPMPPAAAAAVGKSHTAAAVGSAATSASSQALTVVHPNHHHHHHHQQHPYHYHHRHASMPYNGIPGSSPPSSRPLPLPVPHGGGSPQLPFAFTPSVQSLMSLASLHQAMVPLGYFAGHVAPPGAGGVGGGGGGVVGPARGVSGRDITYLATIRRPSWSSRSGSLDPSLASAGAAGPLMASLSPLRDLLESSYSNPSTPGGPRMRPDSADQPRRTSQRHRDPSSSSTSAIFSLSPSSSAVPGTSPAVHLHHLHHQHQRRGAAARAAATTAAAAEGSGAGGGGGGEGTGLAADSTDSAAAAAAAMRAGPGAAADSATTGAAGDRGAARGMGNGSAAAAAVAAENMDVAEPTEDVVPYDLYGTYGDPDVDARTCPLIREDSESDLLPFALDQEGLVLGPGAAGGGGPAAAMLTAAAAAAGARATAPTGGRPRVAGHPAAGPIELTLSIAQARERDVAVGAFVRMMADAAPLAAAPEHPAVREYSPREALLELQQLGNRIQAALEAAAPQLQMAAAAAAAAAPPPAPQPPQSYWGLAPPGGAGPVLQPRGLYNPAGLDLAAVATAGPQLQLQQQPPPPQQQPQQQPGPHLSSFCTRWS